MTTPIAEDFPAIRARLEAIRAEEQRPAAEPERRAEARPAQPVDFYSWLTGGTLWAPGA
ncbi:NAD-glutamate dehydrogenase [Belnapia rosea]|uniref:Uncharacterized protein n=1 Tax=Belnapia rosea TaxID=938405 RepID=A0A1G7AKW6_9PROT|nr:NAD-glutamate dehydrogenase [Belnapia rosea]SDE15117.1 hypothetical protein SAMN04487779_102029 [Belnapia rosea]